MGFQFTISVVLEFVSYRATLQPPPSHFNARRYFGRMLSGRQFEYFPAWEYCGGFFRFHVNWKDKRLLFLNFVFHVSLSCILQLLDWIMGLVVNCPNPLHPILTWDVTLGEYCHADNSNISQHGNIMVGFRFHANWKDERPLFLEFRIMFPCHAHCVCLTESWVWFVNCPNPLIPF